MEKASLGRRRLIKPRAGGGPAPGGGAAGTKALGQRPDHRSFTPHPSRRALSSNCRDSIYKSPSFRCGGGPARGAVSSPREAGTCPHGPPAPAGSAGRCTDQQVHRPPGGRGTRAPGAVNVRLASWTATRRRNLIERASPWFPASHREVHIRERPDRIHWTATRCGPATAPATAPPSPHRTASSAPAAAPAGANRTRPASPPRRAGRHAAAADQWRGRRGGASPAPPIASPSPWGRGRRRLAHARCAPAAMT